MSSPGLSGRPSIPEAALFSPIGRGVLDAPPSRGMTAENDKPRSRGAMRPSFANEPPSSRRGRREGRVSADTHGPRAAKSTRQNHRFSQYRPSLRNGVTAASCSRRCAGLVGHRIATTQLARVALGISVGMPRPHDLTVHVRTGRLPAQPRPSHPTPRVVTIAIRPSCRGGTGVI